MISEGFYVPVAMWWSLDPSSTHSFDCDGCGPKGWVSHNQSRLSWTEPRGISEVMSDVANVAINGMRLSMRNGSWHQPLYLTSYSDSPSLQLTWLSPSSLPFNYFPFQQTGPLDLLYPYPPPSVYIYTQTNPSFWHISMTVPSFVHPSLAQLFLLACFVLIIPNPRSPLLQQQDFLWAHILELALRKYPLNPLPWITLLVLQTMISSWQCRWYWQDLEHPPSSDSIGNRHNYIENDDQFQKHETHQTH